MKPIWGGSFKRATKGNDTYTKLLLHMDGADTSTTFTDASASAHGNASVSGSVQVDTAQAKFGASAMFAEASSDYMYYGDHADWDFGGDPFTIDFWVRFSAITGEGDQTICCHYKDTDEYYLIAYEELDTFKFIQVTSAGAHDITVSKATGVTIAKDVWYHVAVIRGWGGGANSWAICLNGTQIGTTTTSAEDVAATTGNFNIGAQDPAGTANYLDGWLDEFRVSKGIARWTANFTPPPGPYW